MELIRSELQNEGLNEIFNDGQITAFDDTFSFIKKVMNYDDDVQFIVTNRMFQGFTFQNSMLDDTFKKMFVNRFLDREIKFQTLETFSAMLLYTVLSQEKFIEQVFEHYEKYVTGESISKTDNDGEALSDTRQLQSDLPQNNVNLNVDDTVLDYGNQNTITRNKNTHDNQTETSSKQYQLSNVMELRNVWESVFSEIDRNCFLQVW